ncbi:MAG TPA: hypothetical protein VEC35_09325 [Noviherbaspirillum sp.]|nr:hypothetical protein [Noviherbaspirillum sp.]
MLMSDVVQAVQVLVACVAGAIVLYFFNRHCDRKFHFRFFSKRSFGLMTMATFLFVGGVAAIAQKTEMAQMIGWTVIAAGAVVAWWILYQNFTKTNLLYGAIGTAAQFGLFTTFASAGFFVALMAGGIMFVFLSLFQPVYVLNQKE